MFAVLPQKQKRDLHPRAQRPKKKGRPRLRQRRWVLRLLVGSLITLFLLGAVFAFVRLDSLLVRHVSATGTDRVPEEKVINIAEEKLTGNYLLMFPRRNTLWLPKDSIRTTLKERFPAIKRVTVDRGGLSRLTLRITERKPYGRWCGEKCFLIDDTGVVFASTTQLTRDISPKFIGELTETETPEEQGTSTPRSSEEEDSESPLGRRFGNKKTFTELTGFLEELQEEYAPAVSVRRINEKDFRIAFQSKSDLLVAHTRPYRETLHNLKAALKADVLRDAEKPPKYLDLRFENKVFYKFK